MALPTSRLTRRISASRSPGAVAMNVDEKKTKSECSSRKYGATPSEQSGTSQSANGDVCAHSRW